jgi:hypothetical protein
LSALVAAGVICSFQYFPETFFSFLLNSCIVVSGISCKYNNVLFLNFRWVIQRMQPVFQSCSAVNASIKVLALSEYFPVCKFSFWCDW